MSQDPAQSEPTPLPVEVLQVRPNALQCAEFAGRQVGTDRLSSTRRQRLPGAGTSQKTETPSEE